MAYEQKPGDFTIFQNDRKEKETQPDYTGKGIDMNGNPVRIACWKKSSANGKTFLACSMSPPREDAQPRQEAKAEPPPSTPGRFQDEEIPF